jgi:hypothetical protein
VPVVAGVPGKTPVTVSSVMTVGSDPGKEHSVLDLM